MFDVKVKMDEVAALFEAIGSGEVAKHVGVAFGKAAQRGRDRMRARMPDVLGADVEGPGGARGRFGAPTKRTINAVEYKPPNFSSIRGLGDIDTKVYVKSEQGQVGSDQSAYLKYLFGDGPQVRRPGDVGMDNGAVRVPRGRELLLTQKFNVNPYYVGGRQPGGILRTVKGRAMVSSANFHESPSDKLSQAMSISARRRTPSGLESTLALQAYMKRRQGEAGMGAMDAVVAKHGFDPAGVRKAAKAYNRRSGPWWDVFEKLGPQGLPTYFARPPRIRDPAGGTHAIKRKGGKTGLMPNMISIAPEYGEAGPQVGPRLLFASLRQAVYQSKLQAPWDNSMAEAVVYLDEAVQAEIDHALARKEQGRSF